MLDQLVGTKITGQRSGVTAVVDKVLLPEDSDQRTTYPLYKLFNINTTNNSTQVFSDGEELTCSE